MNLHNDHSLSTPPLTRFEAILYSFLILAACGAVLIGIYYGIIFCVVGIGG